MRPDRRLAALQGRHARLEGLLATELNRPAAREEERTLAKRKKLWIKDEVARLERRRVAIQ